MAKRRRLGQILGWAAAVAASGVLLAGALPAAAGETGAINSSKRSRVDIADMQDASSALMALRPVTIQYGADRSPTGRKLQYGLVAEEVAAVYPALVARSADGRSDAVLYQFLPPLLLNEYQKQQRTIAAQADSISRQTARIAELERGRELQRARLDALERQVAEIAELRRMEDDEMVARNASEGKLARAK